jgi:GTP-binding protein Era
MPAGQAGAAGGQQARRRCAPHDVLPWLQQMQERHAFAEFVPMSATRAADVERLLGIVAALPARAALAATTKDALTDRSERFLASEMIREKLFRLTGDELPYTSTVVIDKFEEDGACAASPPPSSSSATRTRAW